MSEKEYRFTKDHEWISPAVEGVCSVGVSDHAQAELGDIVYIELPEPPVDLEPGESAATIESVKAASDVYAPVGGVICEINTDLEDNYQLLNESPYGDGWLFKLKIEDESALGDLMSYDDYQEFLKESE